MTDRDLLTPALQDPLPEGQWGYRRAFVYGLTIFLVIALFLTILLTPSADQQRVAGWLILLIGFVTVLYLVAPSAVELVRMLAHLRPRSPLDRGGDTP